MDIRSFFGSKSKPAAAGSATGTTNASSSTRGSEVKQKRGSKEAASSKPQGLDDDLKDSDSDSDEKQQRGERQRKRLRGNGKRAAPAVEAAPVSNQVPTQVTSTKRKLESPEIHQKASSPRKSTASPEHGAPNDRIKTVLPALATSSATKNCGAASLTAVEGGAAAFFGETPVSSASCAPSPVKRKSTPQKEVVVAVRSSPRRPPSSLTSDVDTETVARPHIPAEELSSVPPVGANGCLCDMRIAFTGTMGEHMSRESLEELVLQYGAKVSKSISGKTTLLVASEQLEDGRPATSSSKYRQAMERKIRIISERDLLLQIQASYVAPAPTPVSMPQPAKVSTVIRSSKPQPSTAIHVDTSDMLWVDKYKPDKLQDVIGGTENIKKLVDWLKRWDAVHIRKTQKVPFNKENPGAKAVLMSGPPGIGKTTLANLVSRHLGYEVLELNASDVRSKSAIEDQVKDVVLSRAMNGEGKLRNRVVVMDEVDGMGGSDRGGIPELIKIIKSAKSPIICVCNDRQERKIRSLANHCYDIRLRRPTKQMVASRLISIAQKEGLMIEQNAGELLVEQMGNDIRQVINAAQMWRAQSNTMRYVDLMPPINQSSGGAGGRLKGITKDKILRQSPFDACGMILSGRKNDINDRYNSFFIDYSLLPLLVQQNYIDSSRNGIFKTSNISDGDKLDMLSQAADSVSDMELAGSAVRGNDMHWELLPLQAACSLSVGHKVHGFQGFPTFPAWLGKYSSTGKSKRQIQELVMHTQVAVGQGFDPVRLEYTPYLRYILLRLLKDSGNNALKVDAEGKSVTGIEEVINTLDSYGLSRDDLMETMKDLQLTAQGDKSLVDHYESMDAKLKAAFTRQYNAVEHKSQALVESMIIGKKRRAAVTIDEIDDEEGTVEDLGAAKAVDNDNSDEDIDLEAFMKKHSKSKKSSRGNATKGKAKAKKKA